MGADTLQALAEAGAMSPLPRANEEKLAELVQKSPPRAAKHSP